MIVFRYDKTFEGLLTAVFDAYARRMWPDLLLAESEPAPLFTTEDHTVATDAEKSGRVWRALLGKLPKDVCNMLAMGWLSEEPGVDMMLARYMRRVFGSNARGDEKGVAETSAETGSGYGSASKFDVATDFSDPDILRVKQLALKVSNERMHVMQFTRFQKGRDGDEAGDGTGGTEGCGGDAGGGTAATKDADEGHGAGSGTETSAEGDNATVGSHGAGATYFAPVSPRYNVLPLAIPYFRDRFRDQKWLIYDIKRRYGFYYDMHEVTEITMDDDAHLVAGRLDEAMMAEDEKLFQSLWKTYFRSMAIKERINPRLQRGHMPKRFWALLTEMQ